MTTASNARNVKQLCCKDVAHYDSQEHPDLWERCRIDTIHCYQCPPGHAHRIQDLCYFMIHFQIAYCFHFQGKFSRTSSSDFETLMEQALPTLPPATRDRIEERLQIVDRDVLPLAMANLSPDVIASVREIYKMLSTHI